MRDTNAIRQIADIAQKSRSGAQSTDLVLSIGKYLIQAHHTQSLQNGNNDHPPPS